MTRVRFAPSPTGVLHIGGIRTALYNYLVAKQQKSTFVLRLEDTDRTRFVEGAEAYIKEALDWVGLIPDEGPGYGGDYGPYRQSERKDIYEVYANKLLASGNAYFAFDTPEELTAAREAAKAAGNHSFKYDATTRMQMRNSLTMSQQEVEDLLEINTPFTIRLKVPQNEIVSFIDKIKGEVKFMTNELDDKVMLKADGMPTYHLANVVDDRLMKITLVIRGDEWLSSTAHHILLYKAFGWDQEMPTFAHLPLILKPTGKGKLSKRDGAKFGIPVFPLGWKGDTPDNTFLGFKEYGFNPKAVVNFLAFLGWNPGTEQEIFSMEDLVKDFSLEKVVKSGARFDYDKARWFNQQYLHASTEAELLEKIRPLVAKKGYTVADSFLLKFIGLMKERSVVLTDFLEKGYYFFEPIRAYEEKPIRKKWKAERLPLFEDLRQRIHQCAPFDAATLQNTVKGFVEETQLGFGNVLPILRIAICGIMKGPDIFEIIALLGKEEVDTRLKKGFDAFTEMKATRNSA